MIISHSLNDTAARKPVCMFEEEFLMSVCLEEYKFFYSLPVA